MHYYLYKITNKINQKFYIGVHSTSKLEDGYMGSGKNLKRAIKKYGKENFEKEILETFDNAKDMYDAERHLVNEEFIKRPDTYNLKLGGEGQWNHINDYPMTSRQRELISLGVRKAYANGKLKGWPSNGLVKNGFAGKTHSSEAKHKIAKANEARVSLDERKRRLEISKLYDFSKHGELSKYAKHIGVSHTQARRILNQNNSA
jgi:group I intron endonuclease